MFEKYLSENQLRNIINTFPLEEQDHLTTSQVANLYNNSISRINRLALKQIKNAPGLPSVERFGKNWKYRMFKINDVINYYLENKYLFSPKLIDDKEHKTIFIESEKNINDDIRLSYNLQDNLMKESYNNLHNNNNESVWNILVTKLEKFLENTNQNPKDNLSWYIEELKKQIEDVKEEKTKVIDELKKEKNNLISENQLLNEKYFEEAKRVEKIYFISDRYDKVMNNYKNIMIELTRLSKALNMWEKIKLWELKKLAYQMSTMERIEVLDSWDIKFLQTSDSIDFINDVQNIPDDLILEKSRSDEVFDLKKKIKNRNYFIFFWIIIIFIYIFLKLKGVFY